MKDIDEKKKELKKDSLKKILSILIPFLIVIGISIPVLNIIINSSLTVFFKNISITLLLIVPSVFSIAKLKKEFKNICIRLYEIEELKSNIQSKEKLETKDKSVELENKEEIRKEFNNNLLISSNKPKVKKRGARIKKY